MVTFITRGNHRTAVNHWHILCIEYISPWAGFAIIVFVVIDTDGICSSESNCHRSRLATAPCPRTFVIISFVIFVTSFTLICHSLIFLVYLTYSNFFRTSDIKLTKNSFILIIPLLILWCNPIFVSVDI